jgi:hypothetical protein
MTRRHFLTLTTAAVARAVPPSNPDITLRISEITADLGPGHSVKTLPDAGSSPSYD